MELRDGMIGRARSGDLAGFVVQIEEFTDEAWLLYYSDPRVAHEDARPVQDRGDFLLHNAGHAREVLVELLDVEWLDGAEAAAVEAEFFSFPEPVSPTLWEWLRGLAGRWRSGTVER